MLSNGLMLAQAAEEAATKSLFDYIRSGGPIGYLIIFLSFVAVGLFIAQLVVLRRARLAPDNVVRELQGHLERHDVPAALAFCRLPDANCFLTRLFGGAILRCQRSAFGFLELKSALEEAGQRETGRLYRATDGIGLIAAVAPMLGLLGTVVGMVGAFDTISSTEGVAKPGQLAGDISVALITTVEGLCVAIPATMAYSWLRNRIDGVVAEVGEVIEALASLIEGAKAQGTPASGAAQGARPRPQPAPAPGREASRA